jgi:hypothetical protein
VTVAVFKPNLELFVSLVGRAAASMRCSTVPDVLVQTANFERETARTGPTEHQVVYEQTQSPVTDIQSFNGAVAFSSSACQSCM